MKKFAIIIGLFGCIYFGFGQKINSNNTAKEIANNTNKKKIPSNNSIIGKVLCGYQGWFNAQNDGADLGWKHYNGKQGFKPGSATIEYWPDVSEFDKDELYKTSFIHKDGKPAYVFSSANPKTVNRHFEWMKDYDIDGVFVQRFTAGFKNEKLKNNLNKVFDNCFIASKNNNRIISVMYDLSGSKPGDVVQNTINDWKQLVDKYKLNNPNNPNILTYKSKAVVSIWGVGFVNREYTFENVIALIDFFKNDPVYGNCTVLLGVPTHWRELKNDANSDPKLHEVIKMADIVHPWTPMRYRNLAGVDKHKLEKIVKDKQWCDANNLLYMPVVFPGFSTGNLKDKPENFDIVPRLKGDFLWRQIYNAISADIKTIYVAMFDEIDEGTAIFKVSNNPPVGATNFISYEEGVPSDYYLWLTGQAGKMLRKEIPVSESQPTYSKKK
jgi:hypothetical protein